MFKLNAGSHRYLKAQLRPLTKPVFWASAGLFSLSLFIVVMLLNNPERLLGGNASNGVANLDGNQTLTPDERARAAEIDDLSVLLKQLDERGALDAASSQPTAEVKTKSDSANKADKDALVQDSAPSPSAPAPSAFEALPLLNLSPPTLTSEGSPRSTVGLGFSGFDPSGPSANRSVGIAGTADPSLALSPLAAALQQANQKAMSESSVGAASAETRAGATVGATAGSAGLFGADRSGASLPATGLPASNFPTANSAIASPSTALNTAIYPATTPSNNAYTQFLNPNLTVPNGAAAPVSAPVLPLLTPASALPFSSAAPNGATPASSGSFNGNFVLPTASPMGTPSSALPQTGFPSQAPASQSSTLSQTAAPFSIPNSTPARYTGNGKINTFANP
ncbi:MAG: hypothetical protein HC824_18540 [Synechococcales cyanobacterium RM1_1_8]|nr:hypothetical protein [Synechococcales cyanobacterium RM1_1_8]